VTDHGREQSLRLAAYFGEEGLDELWSSDLLRAVQTAEIMLTVLHGTKHSISEMLREQGQGIFEGRFYDDPEWRALQERAERAPEEGETGAAVLARMRRFFATLAARNLPADARVGIVSHGGAIEIFLDDLAGRQGKIPAFKQGDVAEIDCADGRYDLRRIFSIFP